MPRIEIYTPISLARKAIAISTNIIALIPEAWDILTEESTSTKSIRPATTQIFENFFCNLSISKNRIIFKNNYTDYYDCKQS